MLENSSTFIANQTGPKPNSISPLHDPVTWYKITPAGTQVAQWDFQNKGRSRWTGTSCFVLEGLLSNLRPSMCDFVPCDRIVQRAYWVWFGTSLIGYKGGTIF